MGILSTMQHIFNKKDSNMEENNNTLIFSAMPDTATAEIKGSRMNPQQAAAMAMKQGHPEGNIPMTLDGAQKIPQSMPMQSPMQMQQPVMQMQHPAQAQYAQPQYTAPAYPPGYQAPQYYPQQYPAAPYQQPYQPYQQPVPPVPSEIQVQGGIPGGYPQENTTGSEIILFPDEYQVFIDLPGVPRENIHIDFVSNQIIVSGERTSMCADFEQRKLPKKRRPVKVASTVPQHLLGKFKFTFPLDKFVDSQKITATVENGVLHLTLGLVESIGGVTVSLN